MRAGANWKRAALSTVLGLTLLALTPSASQAGESTFEYEIGPVPIPDGGGAARLSFDFVAPPGAQVTAVRPNFRVNHRQTRQLRLLVKGPDGTKVLLSDGETHGRKLGEDPCGLDPNDLSFTGFWDSASTTVDSGSPPYSGYFLPHDPLTVFNGQSYAGNWKVIVKDTREGKRGRLKCGLMSIFYS